MSLLTILAAGPAAAQTVNLEAEHARGLQLREENHNEEALAVFQHVYEVGHEPRALARMALAEGALNRWSDAEAHLATAMTARRDRWIRHNRGELRQNLRLIRSHVGTVQVACNVAGAELLVGATRLGAFPLPQPLRMSEGPTELEVRAEGYVTSRQLVTVVANGNLSVVVALAAVPPPPPEPPPSPEPPPAPPPLVCPGVQVSTPETLGHCCWPGQVYSTAAGSCTGAPQCPPGMVARGETCAEAPTPPPAPVVVQLVAPEPPPPSTAPGQFMLAVSGGATAYGGFGSFAPTVQARLGFVLGGHFVLGLTGAFVSHQASPNIIGGALEMGGEFGGETVRVQVGVQTGLYVGGSATMNDEFGQTVLAESAPLMLRMTPQVTLLVFPTRVFYVGIQLQSRIHLVTLTSELTVDKSVVPVGLLELGLRL